LRNFVAVALASAILAACGSSNNNKSTPPATPVSGTVAGAAFTPTDVQAIEVSSVTPCTINGYTFGVKALELKLTSYPNACGDLTSAVCQLHTGQHAVTVLLSRLNGLSSNAPATLAGDYTASPSLSEITTETQNGVPTGLAHVAYAQVDPTCVGTAHPVVARTSTVHIAQDGTTIAGDLSLHFDDGSTVAGSFTAPLCSGSLPGGGDVCALAATFAAGQQLCQPSTCP
jgi:hypothetical protein